MTADGRERRLDTLILATGFAATRFLSAIEVTGRGGLSIADAWSDGAQAYKGVTTAGFPNLFMLYGPNTNADSIITMIEYQVDHVLRQIQRIASEDLAWIDVKPGPMAEYNDEIQRELAGHRDVADGLLRLLPRPERPHRHPVAAFHARARGGALGPRRGRLRGGLAVGWAQRLSENAAEYAPGPWRPPRRLRSAGAGTGGGPQARRATHRAAPVRHARAAARAVKNALARSGK